VNADPQILVLKNPAFAIDGKREGGLEIATKETVVNF
jgi:hypothetical protein